MNKNIPIEPEIELDGGYAYCPICHQPDLEPNNITTKCPNCDQLIDWSWMNKFRE
jgi:endogenous inhibitor of DNA gyrase (YacG/DUF329 family)